MKLLELSHVKKSFDGLEVLKDISLNVEEGEVVAIIGPSGSGKSTLLRCATLLEKMDEGTLKICGKSATLNKEGKTRYAGKSQLAELKSSYGLVFQNFNLFPHYSVMKNVTDAPIHVQKRDKAEVKKEAEELLKKVGLEAKGDSYPSQLSGGQQQRVAIARALATKPSFILADEPTGNLDSKTSQDVLGLLKTTGAKFNQTMIMITHNEEIAQMADRIIRIEDGHVVTKDGAANA